MKNVFARTSGVSSRRGRAALLLQLALTGLMLLSVLTPVRPARAATTCGAGIPEANGTHTRCVADNYVFHLWTSNGFDASQAGNVVIYVHGWSDQCGRPSIHDASDGVSNTFFTTPGKVYVDAVWSDHSLASKFSASGLTNALFVAVQAPTCGATTAAVDHDPTHVDRVLHWPSLDSLLADLGTAPGVRVPSGPIVLIGHSGAYLVLNPWEKNSRVTHVIHLDTFYHELDMTSWLLNAGHTSTVVVTADEYPHEKTAADAMAASVHVVPMSSMPVSLASMNETQQKARVLYVAQPPGVNHMDLVENPSLIPVLLQRVALAGKDVAAAAPPSATGAATPGAASPAAAPVTLTAPVLEIPIPYVNMTDAIANNGNITVPFLAQYISGVYRFLLSIVGLVAAVMIIIGGFQYLTSAGDSGKISAGRKRIVDAVIGLVLAFGSYILLYTLNPNLVSFNALQLTSVKTITFDGGAHDDATLVTGAVSPSSSGKVPYIAQWDEKWNAGGECGNGNLQASGCGPTSLAMVLNSYNISADPVTLEKAARDGGFKFCRQGMNQGALLTGGIVKKYNFAGESIRTSDKARILELLQRGVPLIAGMGGNSIFTFSGHYIVLTGVDASGNIVINDPGRTPSSPYTNVYLGAKCGSSVYGTNTGCSKTVTGKICVVCFGPNIPPVDQKSVPQEYIFPHLSSISYVHPAGAATIDPTFFSRLAAAMSAAAPAACMAT